ncbi:MAG: hypothetical protein L3J39_00895 [Verrucomicrobiales bacterium]|nr:hypothetical protein [Verrucomicrobiales bacterium]
MENDRHRPYTTRIVLASLLAILLVGLGAMMAVLAGGGALEVGAHIYGPAASHLASEVSLPAAVFYLLALATLGFVFLIGRCLYRRIFGKSEVWRDYQMDTFFWVEWQWEYSWKGKVINLWCECDKCAEAMKPKVVPDGENDIGVRFICNRCGKQSTTIRSTESEKEALERVEKKILRKIRVGKYRGEIEGKLLANKKRMCF